MNNALFGAGTTPEAAMALSAAQALNNAGINAAGMAANKAMTAPPKYKKAPDAPKRFKSAFIIFSAEKHKAIKAELAKEGRAEKTTDIAKLVSEAWREMGPEEKEGWEKKARKDKARYEVEKALYKGPWKIPANKRTPKDPSAPKRPMSAFLAYSNKRRAGLKRENPDATNADLSKMLSKSWREAPDELRQKYMDEESELRATYKEAMAKWRKKVAEEKKQERQEREALAMQAAEARQNEAANEAANPTQAAMTNQFAAAQGMGAPGGFPGLAGVPGQQSQEGGAGGLAGSAAAQMYGNPYAMGVGGGAQLGALGGLGMQGGAASDAAQYANLMTSGNPFSSQSFMGAANAASAQQQLLSQILMQGNQLKAPMGQGNPLGMYQGLQGQGFGGQGVPGAQGGLQRGTPGMTPGGFAGNPSLGAFGMGQGMDNMAAQRAMLEAAQAGQMNNGGSFTGGFGNMGGVPGGADMLGQSLSGREQTEKKDDDQFRGPM